MDPSTVRNYLLLLLAAYLFSMNQMGAGLKLIVWTAVWLKTGGSHWLYLFRHTAKRDLALLTRGLPFIFRIALVKRRNLNLLCVFRQMVKENPNKIMFVNALDDKEWTYTQIEEYSNSVANFIYQQGYKKGDTIALFMENRPEHVAIWLGMAKVGVVTALINYNLRKDALIHTIEVASCKGIIYGLELEDAVKEVLPTLKKSEPKFRSFFSRSGSSVADSVSALIESSVDFDVSVEKCSSGPEPKSVARSISVNDPLFYIYTSGTTGLPKAVIIKHIRQLFVGIAAIYTCGFRRDDVIYCHLPLYHSSGSQLGTAPAFFYGATTIIKRKFSASQFWSDCIKYDVTATQYIGEICRYLLNRAPSPEERQHRVRLVFGNGLRAQIWREFVTRFNIKDVAEFYGATEGNSSILNIENKEGAVGFVSVTVPAFFHEWLLPLYVVKVDPETGELLRGPDGQCIETRPGEPGEIIGKIVRGDPVKDFDGYRDKAATSKKIATDVFKKGDRYFRSGDILIRDEFGWLFFQDRGGDTFRWKGENVSTLEVEGVVSQALELQGACSYGVQIPNSDGRAGMVTIPTDEKEDVNLEQLYKGTELNLPAYARPLFVRLAPELPLTGTYKMKKTKLQEEGFDLAKVKDPVFFRDTKVGSYVPLTEELFQRIQSGQLRL